MDTRLSQVSSLQLWCRCVAFRDPLSSRSTSRHQAKVERGPPRFASLLDHCHVISCLTGTYKAFIYTTAREKGDAKLASLRHGVPPGVLIVSLDINTPAATFTNE
jgi:hypothetical protein